MDLMPPTRERLQHGRLEPYETMQAGVLAAIDRRSTMLDRYWQDQLLAPEGDYSLARARYDAGERLASLYDAAGARPRLLGVYGPRSHAHVDLSEHTDDCGCDDCKQGRAFKSYQLIVMRLTAVSPMVASAVVNLCIHDFDPVDRRALIRGLDVLVGHWGLG